MTASDTHRAIDAVWRLESAKVIASVARVVRDVGVAEDLAQDALVAALEQWPRDGLPANPGAWLTTAARRRAIDYLRRGQRIDRKHGELAYEIDAARGGPPDYAAALDVDVGDDMLRLIFTACHPVLSREARVALTLRLVGGLTVEEIARAYLVPAATIAQRLVRAKRTLADKRVPYELPPAAERAERLSSVLEVIYLIFNEGYTATAGDDWIRTSLCEDALRLARVLAGLEPTDPEVHGLSALLEIQASRLRARVGPGGEPIPLLEQNRTAWDRLLIGRGLSALTRAEALGGAAGWYTLQASLAACHARAVRAEDTDWRRMVTLYDRLLALQPSPIVALNRAVAVGMADGPAAGLALVDQLGSEPVLAGLHLVHAVRADLLERLGRRDEASAEYDRAAGLTRNARERDLLLARRDRCGGGPEPTVEPPSSRGRPGPPIRLPSRRNT